MNDAVVLNVTSYGAIEVGSRVDPLVRRIT